MTTKEPLHKWVGNTEEWAKVLMLKWGAGRWVTVVWGDWNVLWFTLICVNLTHKSTWIQCSNKSDRLTPHKIGAWDGFSGKSPKQLEWWHKQSVKPSPSCSSVKWWAAEHGHAQQHCSSAWNPGMEMAATVFGSLFEICGSLLQPSRFLCLKDKSCQPETEPLWCFMECFCSLLWGTERYFLYVL